MSSKNTETISISPRFFRHELNVYENWRQSFFRELVQNSIDARCGSIEISIREIDTLCEITFDDDGPGMDEETMREVYFQLGATGKEGGDTIGGHGRARILTCFAHDGYEIRTRNLLCRGVGGSFDIDNDRPAVKGCSVKVIISESDAASMRQSLLSFLRTCQLPCKVFIDGEQFTEWLYKRKATRRLSFGNVHVSKLITQQTVVRIRGVTMFSRHTNCQTGTILEIDPDKSMEVLPVSRDSLFYDERYELDRFLSEIAIDSQSIKRDSTVNETRVYGRLKRANARDNPSMGDFVTTGDDSQLSGLASLSVMCLTSGEVEIVASRPTGSVVSVPVDYAAHIEDLPRHLVRKTKLFAPEAIKGRRLKLLMAWDAVVNFVMERASDGTNPMPDYMPGFVFSENLKGMFKPIDGGCLICVNPLDSAGSLAVSHVDVSTLLSIALHEVAHVWERYHDECYASRLTDLIARVLTDKDSLEQLHTAVESAVKSCRSALDHRLSSVSPRA